jgi:hypothetical protein
MPISHRPARDLRISSLREAQPRELCSTKPDSLYPSPALSHTLGTVLPEGPWDASQAFGDPPTGGPFFGKAISVADAVALLWSLAVSSRGTACV